MKRTRTICRQPGCYKIVQGGYCVRHRRAAPRKRGYNTEWERVRREYLAVRPFCERCGEQEGRLHVDHKIEVKDRPDLRLDWDNLQTLCQACHNKATKERAMNGGERSKGRRGW